jgi:hypothetical protein
MEAARPPTPTGPLAVGDVVAERYRIDAVLGEGGMGMVYRAEHLHLRKPLALKVLLSEWSQMPEVVARFEREAVAAGNIQSPHVAAATDFGRLPGGSFFLVMEYIDGRTLRSAIEAGAFEPARALAVLRGIVMALQAAHARGIVHRDLKPENVMLVEHEGDRDFVKVLDFGIAKVGGLGGGDEAGAGKPLTRLGAVIGTPDYMSPEQAMGQPVDARSDLYSAGVILFEMLTGQRPYGGGAVTVVRQHAFAAVPELPEAVAADVEPAVRDILRRLLAKTPEARFASADELMAALAACAAEPAPVAPARAPPRAGGAGTFVRYARDRRVLAALFLLAIVTAMIVGLIARSGTPAAPATAILPPASASLPVEPAVAVPSASAAPAPAPLEGPTSITVLPPPPTPSSARAAGGGPAPSPRSSPAKPASSSPPQQQRRTGPGGIYIPPPSQWFK